MSRLIDADTVVTIQVYDDMTETFDTKKMTIAEAIDEWSDEGCPPTVEAEPVRHGHWDYIEEYFADRWWNTYQCSVCGHQEDFEEPYRMKYCPECGAKMDEVTE